MFGVATDTLDASGAVLERAEMPFTRAQLDTVASAFVGDIEQVPPMVSALKVGGRRLYELAREGDEVERAPRPVHIDELVVEEFEPGPYPEATLRVECSSGTYVRTLAADLGAALGGCAHLGALRRLRVGSFTLDEAHPLDAIAAAPEAFVLPPVAADARSPAMHGRRRDGTRGGARRDLLRGRVRSGGRGRGSVRGGRRRGCVAGRVRAAGRRVKPAVVLATEPVALNPSSS